MSRIFRAPREAVGQALAENSAASGERAFLSRPLPEKVDGEVTQSSLHLWQVFRARSDAFKGRVAVASPRREVTFGELFSEAERVAAVLSTAGVAEGTVVALALGNSVSFVASFLALCRLSATVALVSPAYGASGLRAIAHNIEPVAFLVAKSQGGDAADALAGDARGEPLVTALTDEVDVVMAARPERAAAPPAATIIKFSSGSTAEPKGIALPATSVLAEAENVAATLALDPEDRILAVVPLSHSYGFDLGVLAVLHSGAKLSLHDGFVPRRVFAALEHDTTVFLGVPSMYRALGAARLGTRVELARVRYLLSCTAPLAPDLIFAFFDRFGAAICQHYGSSETGAVTTHVPAEILRRPESVGVPMHNVDVRIADPDGASLPAGAEGEVVVASEALAHGYVMGAPAGPGPFRKGEYWTGDNGVRDPDGFLYLRGRKDSMINVGGLKVAPDEVRAALERHPAVREAAVLGVQDKGGDEVVYAVVAARQPVAEEELIAFCRAELAEYKVPRRIELRAELPRGPTGKLRLRAEDVRG